MKRYKHSLSHYHLTTGEMGKLYPVGCYEALPGDTIQSHTSALIRLSPPARPVMHPVVVRFHSWFVPYRLIWEDFEDFMTGGPDGEDASVVPYIDAHAVNGFTAKTLPDYLGAKPGTAAAGLRINAFAVRAFNLIWNKCYRDQDLQTERVVPVASGADTTSPLDVPFVAWEKDRFTAARPWTQKGPDVTIPLGTTAPVITNDTPFTWSRDAAGGWDNRRIELAADGLALRIDGAGGNQGEQAVFGNESGLVADLTAGVAPSILDLRYAMGIQRYQEARALYGSEYVDYLRFLGIRPSDARLQRPEYLGGGKQTIAWSEVVSTTPADDGLGVLGGHGLSAMRTRPNRYFFEEHGICLTLMSVRPKSIYGDGLHRMFSRSTKEDFYQKELELVGQEPIYSRELFAESDANGGDDVFGYGDRYSDYRSLPSRISGEFRDSTLNDWHMARLFSSQPTLNDTFVACDPTDRIFVDQTAGADHLWCMVNHKIVARRLVGPTGRMPRVI